jgi:hypothetical protein
MTTEINVETEMEVELRRLKEDHLAKNHCGYFKLWKMKLTQKDSGGWAALPWGKAEVIGIFPSREPCETFLELIEHGPEATYEYCRFTEGVNSIPGFWDINLDKDGVLHLDKGIHRQNAKWDWGWRNHDINAESGRSWGNKFTGKARTKERAIEMAKQAMVELAAFIRDERPKRVEGCSCTPWDDRPCSKCGEAMVKSAQEACGCPNCKGDH